MRFRWRIFFGLLVALGLFLSISVWFWDRVILGNTTIDFYGQVADTNGNPIAGAKVTCRISRVAFWSCPVPLLGGGLNFDEDTTQVACDEAGHFSLKGHHGYELKITSID